MNKVVILNGSSEGTLNVFRAVFEKPENTNLWTWKAYANGVELETYELMQPTVDTYGLDSFKLPAQLNAPGVAFNIALGQVEAAVAAAIQPLGYVLEASVVI